MVGTGSKDDAIAERQRVQLHAAADYGRIAIETADLERLFQLAVDLVRDSLAADGSTVAERLPDAKTFRIRAHSGSETDGVKMSEIFGAEGTLVALALELQTPLSTGSFPEDPRIA